MKKQFTLLCLLLASSLIINAQLKIKLVEFSSGYTLPLGVENCGDSRLFVVQKDGKIFICDSAGKKNKKPYLDITDRILLGDERGLLGLAFSPDYKTNGYFYLNYINKSGNTQISRFKVKDTDPDEANKNSEAFILKIDQPFANHNGGCLRFGSDGYLYIGMGDGGSGGDPNNNAQNTMSLLGKMLRIDVRKGKTYKIPSDNPFVDSSNYRHEIWALGLRNPWRWSFDALNSSMYIGDVGQDNWEEIDFQQRNAAGGRNYGWRCYEGKHPYDTSGCKPQTDYTSPIFEYSHSGTTGDCSVTGGFVYRGTRYDSLYGKYIFTDYCSGIFRALYTEGGIRRAKNLLNGDDNAYSSFGEDANRELYVCNLVDGKIYHITYPSAPGFSSNSISQNNRLGFSPNPSKGSINITYTSSQTSHIIVRVSSMLGEQVFTSSRNINAGKNSWSENLHLPKGNYYLSIINNSIVTTQSLRIE